MKKFFLKALLATGLLAGAAFGQSVLPISDNVTNPNGTPARASKVYICPSTATIPTGTTPCSPQVSLYTNQAVSNALAQPLTVDALGRFSAWTKNIYPAYMVEVIPIGATSGFVKYIPGQVASGGFNNIYSVDGLTYPTVGSAISGCLTQALTQLQSNKNGGTAPYPSCVVDARGIGLVNPSAASFDGFDPAVHCTGSSPNVACTLPAAGASCVVAGGGDTCNSIPTTILFPSSPLTQNTGPITLESGMELLATVGTRGANNGTKRGAIITCATSTQPCLVLPQNTNQPAQNTILTGVAWVGAAGNTAQNGAYLDCANTSGDGLWYADWTSVDFDNFKGDAVHFSCRLNDGNSAIQHSDFTNMIAYRIVGGGYALYMAGSVGNNNFYGGDFTSPSNDYNGNNALCDTTGSSNGTVVYIGGNGAGTQNAYSNRFFGTAIQGGQTLVKLNGADNIFFSGTHHEGCVNVTNGFLLTNGGSQNKSITFEGVKIADSVGTAPSTGYVWDTTNSGNGLSLHVHDTSWGTVTAVINASGSVTQTLDFTHNYPGTGDTSTPVAQVTTNVVPQFTATNAMSGPLVIKGPVLFSVVNGTGNITSFTTSAMPEGGTFAIRAAASWTIWSASQSASAIGATAYNCTTSSNTQCTITLNNNLPSPGASGSVNVTGASFTGNCAPFNLTPIALVSATPTTIVIPAPNGMGSTSGTCSTGGGTFSLISNIKLAGRKYITPSANQTFIFTLDDRAGLYECISGCEVPGNEATGPLDVRISSAVAGWNSDTVVVGTQLVLPDGNTGMCTQWGRNVSGGFDGTSGQPEFSASMICEEQVSSVATTSFWMVDLAILSGVPSTFTPIAAHAWTAAGSYNWNSGSPIWNLPAGSQLNSKPLASVIVSGTSALGTGAISATTCATVVSTTATGALTTDGVNWAFNAAPGAAWKGLVIYPYPTADHVNFVVCNPTAGSITPDAVTLNWRVIR